MVKISPELFADIDSVLATVRANEPPAPEWSNADGLFAGPVEPDDADGHPIQRWAVVHKYDRDGRRHGSVVTVVASMPLSDLWDWWEEHEPESANLTISTLRPLRVEIAVTAFSSTLSATVEVSGGLWGAQPAATVNGVLDALQEVFQRHTYHVQTTTEDPPVAFATGFVGMPIASSDEVFIGHGPGDTWEFIHDAIKSRTTYTPTVYETSAKLGQPALNTVMETISGSFAAVIIASDDDVLANGTKQARPNVIHEIGLAQGLLGPLNVIVLQHEEAPLPTNLAGVHVMRYDDKSLSAVVKKLPAELERIKAREDA